ncbi:MAG TPA: PPC domain-containing protein, partial [Pirellulaceae bacterium]|nr:PPC domain-containing protein [Pirellulaceae bacterium]
MLATAQSTGPGQTLTLRDVAIPDDGIYRVRVSSDATHVGATGNYVVTVWDSTPQVRTLDLNQQSVGVVAGPYARDEWRFRATQGQQVRLRVLNTSSPGLAFTLSGPDGYRGFTDLAGTSSLLTLPADGAYSLFAYSPTNASAAYSFVVDQTTVAPLALGEIRTDRLATSGARLYRVDVPGSQVLTLDLRSAAPSDLVELYARYGSPPTRETYDFRFDEPGAEQRITVPSATPGAWYVLAYGQQLGDLSSITIAALGEAATVTGVLPARSGNSVPLSMTWTGAGFAADASIELVASDGVTKVAPVEFEVDGFTQLAARFPAGMAPGVYAAQVSRG